MEAQKQVPSPVVNMEKLPLRSFSLFLFQPRSLFEVDLENSRNLLTFLNRTVDVLNKKQTAENVKNGVAHMLPRRIFFFFLRKKDSSCMNLDKGCRLRKKSIRYVKGLKKERKILSNSVEI